MAWPVFKTASEKPSAAPVGSIPTRSRHLVVLLLLLAGPIGQVIAQDTTVTVPATPTDTIAARAAFAPIRPMPAFFMSLLVPGWAQARLDRKLTAGLFIAFEGIAAGMSMKTIRELNYMVRTEADSARLVDKRRQRQDWLILWGFNHLFSGLEAFVSSQLHDFPADVRFRAFPGVVAVEAVVPFRFR